jgi:pyruvate/2-oxoglutarate dehydrogenase complex dihydrolipoamide dehydrogenase (E3) component
VRHLQAWQELNHGNFIVTRKYDAIVVGTGQSGPPLAARMNREGLKVAIIERHRIGGTCVNTGCIPTKTLVGSARIAALARRAVEFGILIDGAIRADMALVKARKDQVAGDSNRSVTAWLEGMENVDLIRGHARFVSPHAIGVNGEVLEAERIFLDVGARARVPDWPGLADTVSNQLLDDGRELPARAPDYHGGSYIARVRADVSPFRQPRDGCGDADRVIARDDDDVSAAVQEILENEGVRFRLNAECLAARPHGDGVAVQVSCREDPEVETGTHLLLAVGRVPNTDDLGLENTRIETDSKGYIKVDEQLRTTVPGVWAIGEVNGRGAFTHTSYNDYEIVAANPSMATAAKRRPHVCYGLFIDPPLPHRDERSRVRTSGGGR